jgi:ubiquitin-like 1-activating enzyme E1 A
MELHTIPTFHPITRKPNALSATSNSTMADESSLAEQITADEIALYDRQIRLWGVKAQESLRKANILLVSLRALANEVAKTFVLAGINSLTVLDHELVTEDDLGAQFFVSEEDVGKNVCFP